MAMLSIYRLLNFTPPDNFGRFSVNLKEENQMEQQHWDFFILLSPL